MVAGGLQRYEWLFDQFSSRTSWIYHKNLWRQILLALFIKDSEYIIGFTVAPREYGDIMPIFFITQFVFSPPHGSWEKGPCRF